jgi:formate hydrogenlyase subunit 6/NADH:ubiquinone oxidoreductase subunit I
LTKEKTFSSVEELEKEVIIPANAIAAKKGFKKTIYIKKYKGIPSKQKYLTIGCTGCTRHCNDTLIWFTFSGGRDSSEPHYKITFARPPYGYDQHNSMQTHFAALKN